MMAGQGPRVPRDLYAFGNRLRPRPPRVEGVDLKPGQRADIIPNANGLVGPDTPGGASLFSDPAQAPVAGHYHVLPAGTELPEGLVLVADGKETSFPLSRDAYTLGRHRNNDIVISDPKVSSFHARIDRSPDGFVLVDLNSRNGTFVNGKRIDSGILKTGDEVRLGTARLLYKVDYTTAVG